MAGMLARGGRFAFGLRSKMRGGRVCEVTRGSDDWSDAELLVDETGDLASVGAALGLAHHVTHDRADRLGVAFPHALGGVGVGRHGRRDDLGELAAAVHGGESLSIDDLLRLAAALGVPLTDLITEPTDIPLRNPGPQADVWQLVDLIAEIRRVHEEQQGRFQQAELRLGELGLVLRPTDTQGEDDQ